ncbi:MAG: carboxymuconolactone decarboxylase family protein [Candidatus Lokiarchaeota archaeon]|nr:carboxymuconolactone decarboxylase family protein [Candidatus Lokiarchaeota archaeon]MBD3340995.1 carboxymuconolactone decarboxylase family protein [Candidatus Lokiarchaeota archaeon]
MDDQDISKIEKIIKDREEANTYFNNINSDVYKAFLDMERSAFRKGELEKKNKELIALGISIVINCESCMEWHTKEALRSGASDKDVIEAIEVAIEMGGGPATVASRFAVKALNYHKKSKK